MVQNNGHQTAQDRPWSPEVPYDGSSSLPGAELERADTKPEGTGSPGRSVWSSQDPGGSDGKESACSAGDLGSIPGSGRSPGEGNGYPLQYSCLENPMDRGA